MIGPRVALFIHGGINHEDGLKQVVQLWRYILLLWKALKKNVKIPGIESLCLMV